MIHPANAHIGQRVRQRRWMVGMTRRQLGGLAGIDLRKLQDYETGTIGIGANHMRDIAAALRVLVVFFYEGLDARAPGWREMQAENLAGEETPGVAGGAKAMPPEELVSELSHGLPPVANRRTKPTMAAPEMAAPKLAGAPVYRSSRKSREPVQPFESLCADRWPAVVTPVNTGTAARPLPAGRRED